MERKSAKNKDILAEQRFTNQNWKRVLREIYDYAPNKYGQGKQSYGEGHPLVKCLKITPYELRLIMAFLEDQRLIEYEKPENNWINLTSKGFDVALQNQNQKMTLITNRILAFLTAVIAISAIVNVIYGITDITIKWYVTLIIVVFLLAIGGLIKRLIKV